MSFKKPIIIPIPKSHLGSVDTQVAQQPTILGLVLTGIGWNFFKQTIFPYIWEGYQVKIRTTNTRNIPTVDQAFEMFKCNTYDFMVRAGGNNGTNGSYSLYAVVPATNTQANELTRWNNTLYTENGVEYSHYSYVIYA